MKELFAFWRYGEFPFVLGGTVTSMDDQGRVQTVEYGPGFRFLPIKLLPVATGKHVLKQLEQLTVDYRTARRELHDRFKNEAVKLLPEIKRG